MLFNYFHLGAHLEFIVVLASYTPWVLNKELQIVSVPSLFIWTLVDNCYQQAPVNWYCMKHLSSVEDWAILYQSPSFTRYPGDLDVKIADFLISTLFFFSNSVSQMANICSWLSQRRVSQDPWTIFSFHP